MVSIAEVLRRYGQAYRQEFSSRMSADQLKAMWAIERCRSGLLGSVVYYCSKCQTRHSVPRSCGNRHCPTCQSDKAKVWLEKQLARLLPCPYFLLTFTVPQDARSIIRSHPRECYAALMDAAAQSLTTLAADPKYIGSSRVGLTAVLHTWGRDLSYNPHVHIVAAGGALSPDGARWLPSRADFFVPVRAASVIFRAKFKAALAAQGLVDLFPAKVWSEAWLVNCKPVGDGRAAMKYLAPYIFRVAISDRRMRHIGPGENGQGSVVFDYRPVGQARYKSMQTSASEFIRRFLQHVLPSGFRKVRHYGFAAARSQTDFQLLAWLVTVTLHMVYVLTVAAAPPAKKAVPTCPLCSAPLLLVGFVPAAVAFHDTS